MEVRVYVRHRCRVFALGTAYCRPGPDLSWEAVPQMGDVGWRLDVVGVGGARVSLGSAAWQRVRTAILTELGETRADRVRRLQDERADLPD